MYVRRDAGVEEEINDGGGARGEPFLAGLICECVGSSHEPIHRMCTTERERERERRDFISSALSSFFHISFFFPLLFFVIIKGHRAGKGETRGGPRCSLKFGGRFKRSFGCVDSLRSV